jgi:hypothetical protein
MYVEEEADHFMLDRKEGERERERERPSKGQTPVIYSL